MKFAKEIKVGIIVFAGIFLLGWGLNYLKGRDFFTSEKLVYAIYDRVDGLERSNLVLVNGMKVGMVNTLVLLPDHSGRILVSMHLSNKVKIPRNSTAQIFNTDLLGAKGVRFIFGDSQEDIQDHDTLRSDIQKSLSEEVNAQVAPFKAKAENLVQSMDSVLQIVRSVFNEHTKENLKHSFESISHSLASIEHVTGSMDTVLAHEGRLREIFDNLESITHNFKTNNQKLTNIINNFSSISDTLAKSHISATLTNLQQTLENTDTLFARIRRGEGTLGQLSTNDSLYKGLNATSHDLDSLLVDFRENPKRYVTVSFISFGSGKNKKKQKH
jgi:phospholipid/cholesterol/gamma-HCH transport system substrate-binding protein